MERNKYGCYSGGSLFDMMDKIAHNVAIEQTDKPCVFTKSAKVKFLRQACDIPVITRIRSKKVWFKKYEQKILVDLILKGKVVCSGKFVFVGKDIAYCKLNERS